jgi:hypothetical protein
VTRLLDDFLGARTAELRPSRNGTPRR